ncbi:MAG: exo-alpha-sialidase [Actinomycetota bacterium]|nr:exo-alpha-sialidase [Actinomycetota bacterium]
MGVLIAAGTRKGLFLLRGEGDSWDVDGPLLPGWEVFHAIVDPRDGVLYACANSFVYGATVHRSDDLGKSWDRVERIGLPEESGLTLARLWHLEPGHASEPETLWLGGDPGCLLRSDDGGASWQANAAMLSHPTRDRWNPGAGGLCCHSITLDPSDPQRLWIGISAAGVFRTDDGGETWEPTNANVAADFLPERHPEVGQCVHKVLAHPGQPERLWQQNHCGVYRSDDGGASWERLDGNGLPSEFGFALALDPSNPDVAYVVPEEGSGNRVTAGGRLGVWRTDDGGSSWALAAVGLPEQAWVAVLREGLAYDDAGALYLGTQAGSVYTNGGGRWVEAARNLPPVLSVEASPLA